MSKIISFFSIGLLDLKWNNSTHEKLPIHKNTIDIVHTYYEEVQQSKDHMWGGWGKALNWKSIILRFRDKVVLSVRIQIVFDHNDIR